MTSYAISIQPGHIARHTPRNAGAQGREAAVVDVAQDLLLRHLHDEGILDGVAIKGGTAIRKLYAGNEGRFSLDLDFALANVVDSRDSVASSFAAAVEGLAIGPFSYGVVERRGKWSVTFASKFVPYPSLQTKLDFAAACWLAPARAKWVSVPIHACYGGELPQIQTVRLEENIAEKVARLNRTTTARDMYDLAWLSQQPHIWNSLDLDLIRRLSVLKIWVDTNGVTLGNSSWGPAHEGSVFDPDRWLRKRDAKEFDIDDIGALAVPAPKPETLSENVRRAFGFLAKLDADEVTIAESSPRNRGLALKMLETLPGSRLSGGLY